MRTGRHAPRGWKAWWNGGRRMLRFEGVNANAWKGRESAEWDVSHKKCPPCLLLQPWPVSFRKTPPRQVPPCCPSPALPNPNDKWELGTGSGEVKVQNHPLRVGKGAGGWGGWGGISSVYPCQGVAKISSSQACLCLSFKHRPPEG